MKNNRLIIGLDDYIFENKEGYYSSTIFDNIYKTLKEKCENYLELTDRGDFLLHLDYGIEDLEEDYKTIMNYIKPYYKYSKAV